MKTLLVVAAFAVVFLWSEGGDPGQRTVPSPVQREAFVASEGPGAALQDALAVQPDPVEAEEHAGAATEGSMAAAPEAVASVDAGAEAAAEPETEPAPAEQSFLPPPLPWAAAPSRTGSVTPPVPAARAAVAVDEASGVVLYDQYAHTPLPPASLTKILTAIVALENSDIDSWAQSDIDSAEMVGSSVMGIRVGEWFTMRDLLYGLMLPSGNDAAIVIGRKVAGTDSAFIGMMNQFIANLGLKESNYRNPHGLTAPGHVSSAYDLAMLSRYAMQNPQFAEIVRTPTWTTSGSRSFTMGNVNSFLYNYPGADGIKTGFTWAAGPTLVASAVKDGRRVYVVILNSQQKDADAKAIFDWVFSNYTWPSEG